MRASAKDEREEGEYMVSEAKTRIFISGAVGMNDRNGGAGVQDPEMKFNVMPWLRCFSRKAAIKAGVISRSPAEEERSGFGEALVKGREVKGSVLAQVRMRLGSVTRRRTREL